MVRVFLALGSNLGDREALLREAIRRLAAPRLRIRRCSSVWETEPVGMREQGWFLNLVLEAETAFSPGALLRHIQQVEAALGRERRVVNGPRTIDIDILLYGDEVVAAEDLCVPHPRMTERRFVLVPLEELASELRHPQTGRLFSEYLREITGQQVRAKRPLAGMTPEGSAGRERGPEED